MRAGDPTAKNDVLKTAQRKLEVIAQRMLHKSPSVRRWAETVDLLQEAMFKLSQAMDKISVADTRAFLGLATTIINRQLIDLARHYKGPRGIGANHASDQPRDGQPARYEVGARDEDPAELEKWTALHAAVEMLEYEEREVFGLKFYHNWSTAQVAELLGVSEKTVGRRLKDALESLKKALGGDLPRI
jgi:RNA polymerase sigma-70 factor (ECF subfamily)